MKYLVIGLGNTGLSIISMLKRAGLEVEGYNRPGKTLDNLKSIKEFKVEGLMDFTFKKDFINEDLHKALTRSDLVFVCVPANEHKGLADSILESKLEEKMPSIILVPGRVFGALNFAEYLGTSVSEAQTVPYAARHDGKGLISLLAQKNKILYSSTDISLLKGIEKKMPAFFKEIFYKDYNYQKVTMSNVGLVLHCTPLLFNAGLIHHPQDFLFYKELISKEIAFYMQKVDDERIRISKELGFSVKSVPDWLNEQYGTKDYSDIYNALHTTEAYLKISSPKSLNHRYLNEDLVYGLVPIENLAINLGLEVPYITHLINTACMLLDSDFRLNYEGIIPAWKGIS
jgi:opine dehydrogenase